jgi:endonuclease/exonuclease/phosphatase family metal-dependent hydrolase
VKALLTLLALLLLAPATYTAGAETDTLRIASWNIRNYLLQNRWEHGRFRFDYPKPEREKAQLRRLLLQVRPDVLLLQEIGSAALLDELADDLAASGLDYPHRHVGVAPDARGGLGLLARIPPREVLFLDPVGSAGAARIRRGVQEAVFALEGARLRVFNVHLKSRYTSDPADPESRAFRTAELAALEALLGARLALRKEAESLLVAGDFNTPFDDAMLGALARDWAPVRVVDAAGEDWTYWHQRSDSRERIDGFWQPRAAPAHCFGVGLFPLAADRPGGSDHRMVVVDWRPAALSEGAATSASEVLDQLGD